MFGSKIKEIWLSSPMPSLQRDHHLKQSHKFISHSKYSCCCHKSDIQTKISSYKLFPSLFSILCLLVPSPSLIFFRPYQLTNMAKPTSNSNKKQSPTKKYSKGMPRAKIQGGNIVDSYQTKVDEVVVHIFTRSDKPIASYTAPMKKLLESEPENYSSSWLIHEWFSRRIGGTSNANVAMTSTANTDYPWQVAVSYKWLIDDGIPTDARSIGKHIATAFTAFSKDSTEVQSALYCDHEKLQ